MRIWSLHPSLLDRQGLIACWRETLLAQARAADSELARSREGKSYAGEADPYRHADEDDADLAEDDAER